MWWSTASIWDVRARQPLGLSSCGVGWGNASNTGSALLSPRALAC